MTILYGGKYAGEIVNGQANGRSVVTWDSGVNKGCRYEGDFVYNEVSGQGTLINANGDVYEGS